MIENLFWLRIGLVVGVVYHAKLQPYVTNGWNAAKAFAAKHGIGVRKDNG